MASKITRGRGKLYETDGKEPISMVSYQLYEEFTPRGALRRWWGELTIENSIQVREGDKYVIELEDKRKGRCSMRRRVNKAVIMVPPRFFYLLQGTGPLA